MLNVYKYWTNSRFVWLCVKIKFIKYLKIQSTNLLTRLKHISSKEKTKHILAGPSLMNGSSIPGTHPIWCHHGSCIFFTLKYNSLRPSHPDSWEENSRHLISFKHWNEKKSYISSVYFVLVLIFLLLLDRRNTFVFWTSACYITIG